MVVDATDPVTDTTWIDWSDLSGSAGTIMSAVFGLSVLLFVVGVVTNSVAPSLQSAFTGATGIDAGEGAPGIRVR